jgi:mono/diheme cytochrome c family protein
MKSVMLFSVAIACSLSLSLDVASGSQQPNGSKNGEEVFLNRCSSCHGTERALVAPRTRKGWEMLPILLAGGPPMRVSATALYSVGFLVPVRGYEKGGSAENVKFVGIAA